MAIELKTQTILPKTIKDGSERVEVLAGQWVSYRYGTPANPIDILLQQVPEGKKWVITANVYIEETDA